MTDTIEHKTTEDILEEKMEILTPADLKKVILAVDPFGRATELELKLTDHYGDIVANLPRHKLVAELRNKTYYDGGEPKRIIEIIENLQ